MRKYAFLVIFSLLSPLNLEAKQLFVKMSFGFHQAGKVSDVWQSTNGSYTHQNIQGEKASLGMDFSLEFIYQLNPNLSLSLGTSYFTRKFNGRGRFEAPEASGFTGYFFISPKLVSDLYSLYLSTIFSFSILPAVQWNFSGGVGYYLGKIQCDDAVLDLEFLNPRSQWMYFLWRYESNSSTVGYHAGSGMDIYLSLNMYLTVEANYRVIGFKKFKSSPVEAYSFYGIEPEGVAGDSTFLYAEGLVGMEDLGDIDYRLSNFNCSGLLFRVGLKFKF